MTQNDVNKFQELLEKRAYLEDKYDSLNTNYYGVLKSLNKVKKEIKEWVNTHCPENLHLIQ